VTVEGMVVAGAEVGRRGALAVMVEEVEGGGDVDVDVEEGTLEVDVDVEEGTLEVDVGVGGVVDVEGDCVIETGTLVLEGIDAVTVANTMTVVVELRTPKEQLILASKKGGIFRGYSQPTPLQSYPGIQHPPPSLDGHDEYPDGQLATCPAQLPPAGQHPTIPSPVSGIMLQVNPF